MNKKLAENTAKLEKADYFLNVINQVKDSLEYLQEIDDNDVLVSTNQLIQSATKEFLEFEKSIYYFRQYDSLNAILEFHPGAGGTEAHDWTSMLLRMYLRYAESKKYSVKILDMIEGDEAGISSCTILVSGKNAYGNLRSENGVHRLVRISPFDASGSRHTSFASVSVIPEMNDSIEININPADLKIDTYHSSGAGGQNVNKTESAVRITHLPTGIVVSCQVERDQLANKETCMEMLKAKLQAKHDEEVALKVGGERRLKVGTGERNERIRTYNYPQNRVTDHRIGYTTLNLPKIIDGDLDDLLHALEEANQKDMLEEETKKLKEMNFESTDNQ